VSDYQDQFAATDLGKAVADLPIPGVTKGRPEPLTYTLTLDEIAASLPAEYRDARPLESVAKLASQVYAEGGSLLILGPPGTGKTRQLYGLLLRLRRKAGAAWMNPGQIMDWELNACREWTVLARTRWADNALRDIARRDALTIISESTDIRRHRYDREMLDGWSTHEPVLAIDDVGCIKPSDWVLEAVYEIATNRRKHKLPTIWTSNLTPDEIRQQFGGAIASRLLGGSVIEIGGDDHRMGAIFK
jgi:hypothetical protein